MSWGGKQHPLEAAIEWLAPVPLALAVAWAGARLGLSLAVGLALGAAAFATGFLAMRLAGSSRLASLELFEPVEFEPVEPDELLLEEKDSVLELSDRLEAPAQDARVVRLFERQDPTPGELVDRIVDFLSDGGRHPTAERQAVEPGRIPDASAALHDALANIRASLR